jgi:hypothetical protein
VCVSVSRDSSVSIVSGYGLDDRAFDVRSPAEENHFSSNLCVQTGSWAHSVSFKMGTVSPFLGGKARPGRDADHSLPSSAVVVNEQELYLLSPCFSIDVLWDCFIYIYTYIDVICSKTKFFACNMQHLPL